mgnify:CR=1 FL=1
MAFKDNILEFSDNKITMTVKPESNLPLSGVTENGQFKVNLWWTKELQSGEYTVVRYDILDTFYYKMDFQHENLISGKLLKKPVCSEPVSFILARSSQN